MTSNINRFVIFLVCCLNFLTKLYPQPYTNGVMSSLIAEINLDQLIQKKSSEIEEVKERENKIREEFQAEMKVLEDRREELENDLGKFRFLQRHVR